MKDLSTLTKKFGSLLDFMTNETGSMRSETHVAFFLDMVLRKAIDRLRALLPRSKRSGPVLLCEDRAPGHEGDTDGYLKLQAKHGKDRCVLSRFLRSPWLQH